MIYRLFLFSYGEIAHVWLLLYINRRCNCPPRFTSLSRGDWVVCLDLFRATWHQGFALFCQSPSGSGYLGLPRSPLSLGLSHWFSAQKSTKSINKISFKSKMIEKLWGQITVAKSFWDIPLAWRPCWISLPKSRGTLSCFSSSVSRSNLAVFFVVTCCLFAPAPPAKHFSFLIKKIFHNAFRKKKMKENKHLNENMWLMEKKQNWRQKKTMSNGKN